MQRETYEVDTLPADLLQSKLAEISAELGVTGSVVRVARHRALVRLRDCVGLPATRTT